jgi:hypothetical protein
MRVFRSYDHHITNSSNGCTCPILLATPRGKTLVDVLTALGFDYTAEGPLRGLRETLEKFLEYVAQPIPEDPETGAPLFSDTLRDYGAEDSPELLEDWTELRKAYTFTELRVETGHYCQETENMAEALLRRFLCYDQNERDYNPHYPNVVRLLGDDLVLFLTGSIEALEVRQSRRQGRHHYCVGARVVIALRRNLPFTELLAPLGIDFSRHWMGADTLDRFSRLLNRNRPEVLQELIQAGKITVPPGLLDRYTLVTIQLAAGHQCGYIADLAEAILAYLVFGDEVNRFNDYDFPRNWDPPEQILEHPRPLIGGSDHLLLLYRGPVEPDEG